MNKEEINKIYEKNYIEEKKHRALLALLDYLFIQDENIEMFTSSILYKHNLVNMKDVKKRKDKKNKKKS